MIFLDAAYPGSAAACQQAAQAAGAGGWFVYVGGPRCAGHWTPDLAQQIRALGFETLPIFVGLQVGDPLSDGNGYQDGLKAVALAQSFGFGPGPLVLDVEAGTASFNGGVPARAYASGWIRAVRSQGWRAWIYSVTWFVKSVDCDGRWAAAYTGQLVDPASLGVDAVQSINSVRYGPLEVDVSTVNLPQPAAPLAPAPAPTPTNEEDPEMFLATGAPMGSTPVYLVSGAGKLELASDQERDDFLQAMGQPAGTASVREMLQATLAIIPDIARKAS